MHNDSSKRTRTKRIYNLILYILMLIFMVPVLWVVLTSLRPDAVVNARFSSLFLGRISIDKYLALLGASHSESSVPFDSYLVNSVIVASLSSTFATILGTMAAFGFIRLKFKGRSSIFSSFMLVRAIPGIALSLPLFIMFAWLRLLDKVHGLALVYVALGIPFVVWLMTAFFNDIPSQLDDSAKIDGCSLWQALRKIDIPISWPGIWASWIFVFLSSWNEFPIAGTLTRTTASKTFPVGLFDFSTEFTVDWHGMAAMSVIMLIPSVLFVLATQRHFIRGLTFGVVKG